MKPTPARIVLYVLSQADCDSIEASRARMAELLQISAGQIGNSVKPGDIVPAIIVRAWSDTCINAQAILDGGDTHWLLSRSLDAEKSHQSWHWPERVPVQATVEMTCELDSESEVLAKVDSAILAALKTLRKARIELGGEEISDGNLSEAQALLRQLGGELEAVCKLWCPECFRPELPAPLQAVAVAE